MKKIIFIAVTLLIGGLLSCSQEDDWKTNTTDWEIKDTTCPCEKPEFLGNIKGEVRIFDADNIAEEAFFSSTERIVFYRQTDNTIRARLDTTHKIFDSSGIGEYGIICNLPLDLVKNGTIPQEGMSAYYEGQAYKWCEESGYDDDPYLLFTYLVVLTKLKTKNHEN